MALPAWCMPGSVLSALWGTLMPRVAALMWKAEVAGEGFDSRLAWPPGPPDEVLGNLPVYSLKADALTSFRNHVARVGFGAGVLADAVPSSPDGLTGLKRVTHLVLQYFASAGQGSGTPGCECVPVRMIQANAYDFVLSSAGLDIFIPPNPFMTNGHPDMPNGQAKVLQMYKFRETGKPPVGLPGNPSSFAGADYLVPIPQLTAPTGAHQIHEVWVRERVPAVDWWLAGSSYRGMMAALPRIIANLWYEQVVWPTTPLPAVLGSGASTQARFPTDLRLLLAERMETALPVDMDVCLMDSTHPDPEWTGLPCWTPHDIMITNTGLYFPDPGPPPDADRLLDAIERGQAGNPVFTDSVPCALSTT